MKLRGPLPRASIGAVALLWILGCSSPPDVPSRLLGAYGFEDGTVVSIRPSLDETLRYRTFGTGESGRLYRESETSWISGSGFSAREPRELVVEFEHDADGTAKTLHWTRDGGDTRTARRIGRGEAVAFESDGTRLVGRLHTPDGEGPHPAMVLVHGSGRTPGSTWAYNGDFLVAHGIAVLAFDKRGTGGSAGDFTFDFRQLARDVVVAVQFLRNRRDISADRIGLAGYSQGGWVAPLAASMVPVSCVLVSYGMLESPAEEARLEMLALLERADVDARSLAVADTLIRAAVDVVASGLDEGWDRFDVLKRRHHDAPWRAHLRGTPVDQLMRYPAWLAKLVGRRRLPNGLDWNHDSIALLDTLDVPMTWFLGTDDRSAPNAATIEHLTAARADGRPVDLHLYDGAGHGMVVFDRVDGDRVVTGYAPDYWADEVHAATSCLLTNSTPIDSASDARPQGMN